jgi:hypothetical protein
VPIMSNSSLIYASGGACDALPPALPQLLPPRSRWRISPHGWKAEKQFSLEYAAPGQWRVVLKGLQIASIQAAVEQIA